MISGEPAFAGSFVEVSTADAHLLVGSNKARFAPEPEPSLPVETEPACEVPKRARKPATQTAPKED